MGDTLKAVVKSVNIDKNLGLMVELSRTSPKFWKIYFTLEVPELKDEKIIIESSARIPGSRSKNSTYIYKPTNRCNWSKLLV